MTLDLKGRRSMNRMSWVVMALVSVILPAFAWAGTAGGPPTDASSLPEPGTFELLALGGVVAAIIAIRNWRKK
jgi:hypothetical protein